MQRVTKTELFTTLVGFTLMIQGCIPSDTTPAIGYYYPTISLCLGMTAATSGSTPAPDPTPTPAPVIPSDDKDKCPRCNGTGKVKFLGKQVECRKCGGTGKIKKQTDKPKEEYSVVDRSWLAPEDFVHDMQAYYAARRLAKDGDQCLLIDFAPDWCKPCHEYNQYFDKPEVIEQLEKDFVLFRVKDGDLYKAFGLDKKHKPDYPVPRMIVVAPNGNYRSFNPEPQYFNDRLNRALNSLGVK